MTPLSVRIAEAQVLVVPAFSAFFFLFKKLLCFDKTLSSERQREDTTTVR